MALQAVLVASAIVALRTGESEEERVERVVPEQAVEQHEEAAEIFVWASGGVLAVMIGALLLAGRQNTGIRLAAIATLGTLAVLGLGYRTGEAGGALVFRHGAARVHVGSAQPASSVSRGRQHRDHD